MVRILGERDSGRVATTSDDGGFRFSGLSRNQQVLHVSRQGYREVEISISNLDTDVEISLSPMQGLVNERFSGHVCDPSPAKRILSFRPQTSGLFRLTSIAKEPFEDFRVALYVNDSVLYSIVQQQIDYEVRGGVLHEIVVSGDLLYCPFGAFVITYLRPE